MATFQQRINQPGGLVLLKGSLTAQGAATVSDAITSFPPRGIIRRADFRLVSGSGTTIDPQLSRSATVFTVPELLLQPLSTPAAQASTAVGTPYVLLDGATVAYIRPQCDSAADNVVSYEILIDPGASR